MSRFQSVPEQVKFLVNEIKVKEFPQLDGANIKSVFDTKKRVSGGRIIVARIKKMNDELKFFAMDDMGLTPDYVIFFDMEVWNVLDDRDKERVVFHELCHTEVDFDKTNPYGIKDHEIQGFYDEASYNADDNRWSERVGLIAQSVYDPESEVSEESLNE